MHRHYRGWLVGTVGLCAGLLLLDGTGHVRDAEGCSGAPSYEPGGGGGEQPPACGDVVLDHIELLYTTVPAQPFSIPLEVRARCATAGVSGGVVSAPIEVTVRPAGGGEEVAGSTAGNKPFALGQARTLAWTPAAPLAAGAYVMTARLEGAAGAVSATFEAQAPYAPALNLALTAVVSSVEDPGSEKFCCQDCGQTSCVHARSGHMGWFRIAWAATPWTAATVSWDGAAARSLSGATEGDDSLEAPAPGQHCARVVFTDLTTGAPLGDQTLCETLCFEPSGPTSCATARSRLQRCGSFDQGRADFLEQLCGDESAAPVCDGTTGPGADDAGSSAGCSQGARAGGGWLLALAALAAGRRRRAR